jgi:hypothetical protein
LTASRFEELLFGVAFGLYRSGVYEHYTWTESMAHARVSFVTTPTELSIVGTRLKTPFDGRRHARRIAVIDVVKGQRWRGSHASRLWNSIALSSNNTAPGTQDDEELQPEQIQPGVLEAYARSKGPCS